MTLTELLEKILKNGRGAICDFKQLVKVRSKH